MCVCVCTVSYTCVAYSVARSFNYLLLRYLFWGCSERYIIWQKDVSHHQDSKLPPRFPQRSCCAGALRDTWTLSFRESSASYNLKWLCWNLTPLLCPRDLQRVWNLMHLKTLSLYISLPLQVHGLHPATSPGECTSSSAARRRRVTPLSPRSHRPKISHHRGSSVEMT